MEGEPGIIEGKAHSRGRLDGQWEPAAAGEAELSGMYMTMAPSQFPSGSQSVCNYVILKSPMRQCASTLPCSVVYHPLCRNWVAEK